MLKLIAKVVFPTPPFPETIPMTLVSQITDKQLLTIQINNFAYEFLTQIR